MGCRTPIYPGSSFNTLKRNVFPLGFVGDGPPLNTHRAEQWLVPTEA